MPKPIKVLMVDDDKMLLDMYKERLEMATFEVETSSNGEECLAKIHQVKPDIILLDIMMPKVNGYDTLSSIKSDPATKDIPVIILSALVRDINKSRAIEAGADDYIIKSEVMPADVIKKIESVLAKYHKDVNIPDNPTPPPPSISSTPPPPPAPPVEKPPVAPPPPPPATPEKSPPAQDIQFEPAAQTTSLPPPPPPSKEENPPKKRSSLVLFFLILIVLLIIVSDVFFYLRFIGK